MKRELTCSWQGTKYLAVFIWAIIYNVLSMVFGLAV